MYWHLQVVGKATSAHEAEDLVQQLQPQLLLTDISMGNTSGLSLTKSIVQRFPLTKIMVLSMHDDMQHVSGMMEAGAQGYLLKNVKQAELFASINEVMAGRPYIQQCLSAGYNRFLQQKKEGLKNSQLTPREIEIIKLVAREMTSAEISRHLFISELTVETHRKNISRKTGTKTVIGLLNYAREQSIL